jgi:hypothetical protein
MMALIIPPRWLIGGYGNKGVSISPHRKKRISLLLDVVVPRYYIFLALNAARWHEVLIAAFMGVAGIEIKSVGWCHFFACLIHF